jgi:predicted extracellular nuclease
MSIAAVARRLRVLLGALAVTLLVLVVQPAGAVSPDLVISQVYGGGGNAGATYTHDYIEIFNRGSSSVELDQYSLQYASATGTGNFGANSGQLTELPLLTLAPGQYALVQEATQSSTGSPLPTPDVTDATPIAMAAGAGKVALVDGDTSLGCNGGSTPCDATQLARIVDLVGYGNANFFEGSGPAGTLSSTTAALRNGGGCQDTDSNAGDFTVGAPTPRNTASPTNACGDSAPAVSSTTPANGALGVPVSSDVTIGFTEPVNVTGSWFTIACGTSGDHTASVSGGPSSFTLDPDADFVQGETCTVTVLAAQVTDQDAVDPPDNMAADHVFSFTTFAPPPEIAEIQGAAHISPKNGQGVAGVEGIVTARRTAGGRGVWIQDPTPDADPATSDAVFVFTNATPTALIGDHVSVTGTVSEFRPGNDPDNLTITQITSSNANVVVQSSGNALPAPTVLGVGGRTPPTEVIDDDNAGNVETGGTFDPAGDGIDFYESLEGMILQVNDASVVNATRSFGEITLLPDEGSWATGLRTPRGGILLGGYADPNPERIIVDDEILRDLAPLPRPAKAMPDLNVGDQLTSAVVGPLDYSFSNYKIQAVETPTFESGGLEREVAEAPKKREVTFATFNVENLAGTDPQEKYDELADLIVNNLLAPDVIGIEEVQDNDGVSGGAGSPVVDATTSWTRLVTAIEAAGGPLYEYRQIDPVDDADGGAPGGNIRVGFLFRTDTGVKFVDRPGGSPTTETTIVGKPHAPELSASPGRIGTQSPAFDQTRKSLVGEFKIKNKPYFVIVNHFSSKGDDQPLFGPAQPPTRFSEVARHGQAQVVNDFVDAILARDRNARVVVLGDINDFEFSETVSILEGGVITTMVDTLPPNERYSYVFEGNSQVLDQILVSNRGMMRLKPQYDVVHVNSEFADAIQASDHEPAILQFSP